MIKMLTIITKNLVDYTLVMYFLIFLHVQADRLVVDTNAVGSVHSAVLVSPPYDRSRAWHSKCFKFRYMLRGPGKKTMTVYQKTKRYREIPVWTSRTSHDQDWSYGQVPLSAVSEFQVIIHLWIVIVTLYHFPNTWSIRVQSTLPWGFLQLLQHSPSVHLVQKLKKRLKVLTNLKLFAIEVLTFIYLNSKRLCSKKLSCYIQPTPNIEGACET